jgi:integrase/recombinase XerD
MTTIDTAICSFLAHRKSKDVVPETVQLYTRHLGYWLDWHLNTGRAETLQRVTADDLRAYLRYLKEEHVPYVNNEIAAQQGRVDTSKRGLSQHSQHNVWRCLKSFWRYCREEGLLTSAQETFFTRDRIPAPRIEQGPRPVYTDDQFETLLKAAETTSHSHEQHWRNRAILLMFRESGLRNEELCSLTDEAVDLDQRRALVIGKGRKPGYVFWGTRTAVALKAYLAHRRGPAGGPMFRTMGSKSTGEAMTTVAIRRMVTVLAKAAGVELPKGAPIHALRHTFAHDALEHCDVSQVSQLLRHTSLETTMIYVRSGVDDLQAIHRRVIDA